MQTQTLANEQVESFMELMRKAWSSFIKTVKRMVSVISRTVRAASIAELESRSDYAEFVYPIEKVWSWPVPRVDEIRRPKGCDKLISRLKGIQRRTRKPRIKKKLGKRISQLDSKCLATPWGCRLDC